MKSITAYATSLALALTAGLVVLGGGTQSDVRAETVCKTDTPVDELSAEQSKELYACAIDGLVAGWQKGGHPIATEYRNWAPASSYASAVGTHGNRMLFTFANDVAQEQYLKFEDENVVMPVGSILAKESFNTHTKGDKIGQVRSGPLFLMEKVAKGTFDETANWKYTLITPAGAAWLESGVTDAAKVQKFCHECHANTLEFQDGMYYPDEDARVSSN